MKNNNLTLVKNLHNAFEGTKGKFFYTNMDKDKKRVMGGITLEFTASLHILENFTENEEIDQLVNRYEELILYLTDVAQNYPLYFQDIHSEIFRNFKDFMFIFSIRILAISKKEEEKYSFDLNERNEHREKEQEILSEIWKMSKSKN